MEKGPPSSVGCDAAIIRFSATYLISNNFERNGFPLSLLRAVLCLTYNRKKQNGEKIDADLRI